MVGINVHDKGYGIVELSYISKYIIENWYISCMSWPAHSNITQHPMNGEIRYQ